MTNLSNRVRRGTISLTLMTAAFGFASASFAGDCSSTKSANSSMIHKASYSTASNSGTIVDAAVATDSLSTLVTAVTAADLATTLSGDGPFTVFAPVNSAFEALPSGTVPTLLKPKNKGALTNILTSHVVAGNLTAKDIISAAKKNGGTAEVETLSGAKLTAVLAGDMLYVKDEKGGLASVTTADVQRDNGVVHIVNRVLLPADRHS